MIESSKSPWHHKVAFCWFQYRLSYWVTSLLRSTCSYVLEFVSVKCHQLSQTMSSSTVCLYASRSFRKLMLVFHIRNVHCVYVPHFDVRKDDDDDQGLINLSWQSAPFWRDLPL